jgi:hypothetical protein
LRRPGALEGCAAACLPLSLAAQADRRLRVKSNVVSFAGEVLGRRGEAAAATMDMQRLLSRQRSLWSTPDPEAYFARDYPSAHELGQRA